MTIDEMNTLKTDLRLTYQKISQLSGIPLRTVQNVFSGTTKAPRAHTLDALEAALKEAFRKANQPATGLPGVDRPTAAIREATTPYDTLPATQGRTLKDYYALPEDQRAELIDGVFYDMAAPSYLHQLILGSLHHLFFECILQHGMGCEVFMAPCDVRLDQDNRTMVQPDLLLICKEQDYLHLSYLDGAPDLAAEILSPATRSKDMILKLYKYQNAGVREYWIVDPETQTVTVHNFEEAIYAPRKYSFPDQIPIGISGGTCTIDFSRIQERIVRYETESFSHTS